MGTLDQHVFVATVKRKKTLKSQPVDSYITYYSNIIIIIITIIINNNLLQQQQQ